MRNLKHDLIPHFNSILNVISEKYPQINEEFYYLYNKRIYSNILLLRPFLTKLIFELNDNVDWESHARLFALIEIVNISTYQSNLAFDKKNGIKTDLEKFNQFISSYFSTFIFFDEIIKSQYDLSTRLELIGISRKNLTDIYYGQYLDLNILKFSNSEICQTFETFEENYIKRCEYLGSSLINICISCGIILNKNKIDIVKNELTKFGVLFGLAGQIVNDLGDITSKGRIYSINKYSDIENERLTLPIYYLMKLMGDNKPNKEKLFYCCNDYALLNEMILKIKSYLSKYIEEINIILCNIESKGFDIQDLKFLSKLLEKSIFFKTNYHVF